MLTSITIPADDIRKRRFMLNMSRVAGLMKLSFDTPDSPKPKRPLSIEGAKADLHRAVVVFLHATFEDVLRSLAKKPNKKMTFSSRSDLNKAFKRAGIDPKPFEFLYPPLTTMAKRRNQIVHNADLPDRTDAVIKDWSFIDQWQIIMWNLAVLTFHYQIRISTKQANLIEKTMYKRLRHALISHSNWGKQMLAFATLPPEWRPIGIEKLSKALTSVMDVLHIDYADFAIEVWDPAEKVWEEKPVDNVLD